MLLTLALAFMADNANKGNVIPGLSIAVLGVIANTLFWRKYSKLNRAEPNAILTVQATTTGMLCVMPWRQAAGWYFPGTGWLQLMTGLYHAL